jgi:aspartate kinase
VNSIKVLKFGGTSLADSGAFARAVEIVRNNRGSSVVVVVSAMSGVTDALITSVREPAAFETHLDRHLQVARSLSPAAFANYSTVVESAGTEIIESLAIEPADLRTQDAIASFGERLCAALFTMMLEHHGVPASHVDARACIVTDDEHGNANPLLDEVSVRTNAELKPLLEDDRVPVLGGFIGATLEGVTTTLGRGSSDYTATLIGAALQAEEIQIWTDVDGVQTANPKLVTATRTVPVISYEEARQLAVLGARVMHPKMIDPVVESSIPIWIRNSRFPEQRGTLICAPSEPPDGNVKAIVNLDGLVACVGDGLGNGTQGAARVRRILHEMDPSLRWRSTADSNLIANVDHGQSPSLVKRLHARLFEST